MSINWQRIKQVLAEAAEHHSPAERAAYLDDACRGDEPLRMEVEKLLRAHDQAAGFLEQPAITIPEMAADRSAPLTEKPGDWIGPYKLLQQIGEGGCGVVYMAEQEQPIRRRVALKVIKLGMDTKSVIARFEAERQALALMEHPNIARVLDAGAIGAKGSESQISNLKSDISLGRPYFVMELVRGIKITDYCDQHQLSTEARLKLFVQVCHALQHAHQKGIIHRDIKPSNILVTLQDGQPVPKVIDFGIAKATDQRLTDKTLFTAFEQFIGTPAYMSPEQAQMSAMDIDTRSDIYALGVLLYELLTGQTPFDAKELVSAGLDGMRQIIREQEPKRPSTRLSGLAVAEQTTVAKCRQAEPPQLIHRLRGDLDWIVMRCLEKDRTRRYETANNLAEDVQRHLNNGPVTARPPSKAYQFQKLVQRNKITFAAGGLVTAALVVGLGFSLWTLAKERVARRQALAAGQKAQAEAGKSQQVAQFLKDMLQGVGPSVALGRDTTMLREILDKTAERVGNDLQGQPEVEAELRTTLGEVYQALGQYAQAEGMYRKALALRRALWGDMNTNVADSLDLLGHELHSGRCEAVESVSLLEQALMIRTNLLGPEHVQVAASLQHLGGVRLFQGRLTEAADLLQRSLAMRRRLRDNQYGSIAETLILLADTTTYLKNPEEGETYAREALALLSRLFPDELASPAVASAQEALARALRDQDQNAEALDLLQSVVRIRRNLLGNEHPILASALYNLGCSLVQANRFAEGETMVDDALAICRRTVNHQHTITAFCLEAKADLLRRRGRYPEAETALREAWAIWKPLGSPHAQRVRAGLAVLLRAQQRSAEAEALMSEAVAEARAEVDAARSLAPSKPRVEALLRLTEVLWTQGQAAEAERWLAEAFNLAKQLPPATGLADGVSFQAMRTAALQVWLGRNTEHSALCRQMLSWAAEQPEFLSRGRAAAMVNLRHQTDPQLLAKAVELARQALAAAPTNGMLPWYQIALGVAEYRNDRFPEALRMLSASEAGPITWHPSSWMSTSKFFQAMMLFRQGQPAEARRLFAEAEAQMPPLPASLPQALAEGADYDELMMWLAYRETRELLKAP